MAGYAQMRKQVLDIQDAEKITPGKQPDAFPNSAMLRKWEIKDEKKPNLEGIMRNRVQQAFLQNQIPSAEREAERFASAQNGARTPEEVKLQLGRRMGADFSSVRFHTDSAALRKAEMMGARAYTTGHDVYFGPGGFSPGVAAHELVHTVQQGVVDSAVPTEAAPAGEVQMLPNWMKKSWAGISEFVGGKMGLLKPGKAEKQENAARAGRGDFSRVARMDKKDRKAMDAARQDRITRQLAENPDMTSAQIAQRYGGDATRALDPINRKALSDIARAGGETGAKVKEATEMMDQRMMMDTILGPGQEERQRLKEHYLHRDDQARLMQEYGISKQGKTWLGSEAQAGESGEEAYQRIARESQSGDRTEDAAQNLADRDIDRAQESGDSLMRTMFLMQMGDFQRTDEKKNPEKKWWQFWKKKKVKEQHEWSDTMANAFSHGGRTAFVFGANDKNGGATSDDVADALFGTRIGEEMGHRAGVHARAAGTHHVATPGRDKGLKGYEEHGGIGAAIKSATDSTYHHHGMDMAIGGIGKLGGRGAGGKAQMINADGRSGHMYIGRKSSTDTQKGALLMGLESDSPYRMNQTGHMHNAAAQAEEGSSTGGLKQDIRGKKYGGRTVDLSGLENSEVTGALQGFTGHMENLRRNNPDDYKALVAKMTGKRLTDEEMTDLMVQFMPQGEAVMPEEHRTSMAEMIKRARKRQG